MKKTIQYICVGIALLCSTGLFSMRSKRLIEEKARIQLQNMLNNATRAEGDEKTKAYQAAQKFIEEQIRLGVLSPHHVRRTTSNIKLELAHKGILEDPEKKMLNDTERTAFDDIDIIKGGNFFSNMSIDEIKKELEKLLEERQPIFTEKTTSLHKDKKFESYLGKEYLKTFDLINLELEKFASLVKKTPKNYTEIQNANGSIKVLIEKLEKLYKPLKDSREEQDQYAISQLKELHLAITNEKDHFDDISTFYEQLQEKKAEIEKADLKAKQKEAKEKEAAKKAGSNDVKSEIIDKIIEIEGRIRAGTTLATFLDKNVTNIEDAELTEVSEKEDFEQKSEDELIEYVNKLYAAKDKAEEAQLTLLLTISYMCQDLINDFDSIKEHIKDKEIIGITPQTKTKIGEDTTLLKNFIFSIHKNLTNKIKMFLGETKNVLTNRIENLKSIFLTKEVKGAMHMDLGGAVEDYFKKLEKDALENAKEIIEKKKKERGQQ